eukprot:6432069-Karenia_brevis.AAC.1
MLGRQRRRINRRLWRAVLSRSSRYRKTWRPKFRGCWTYTWMPAVMCLLAHFLIVWQVGFCGLRVGEASNPGPFQIKTANVTSLWTQFSEVVKLPGQ